MAKRDPSSFVAPDIFDEGAEDEDDTPPDAGAVERQGAGQTDGTGAEGLSVAKAVRRGG